MMPPNIKYYLYFVIVICLSIAVFGQPTGLEILQNQTDIIDPAPAAEITTPGGSFTTLVLYGEFQSARWKAYVGNVSGKITLDDVEGGTIYDWSLVFVSGQIYVSRINDVDWGGVSCVEESTLGDEQVFLEMDDDRPDNINNTFNMSIHKQFYVGTQEILGSSCRSVATYVNDTAQTPDEDALFQQILLQDSSNNIIYTTILEQAAEGYDLNKYDFQMIVPENDRSPEPTTYYFFAEIS